MMNFLRNNIKSLWLKAIVVLAFLPTSASATHIIGGDITYRFLGGNKYEITLTLRRDCELGQVGFDRSASIGIFGVGTNQPYTLLDELRLPFMASDTIGNTIVSSCGFEGSEVCVQRTAYRDTVSLNYIKGGYLLAYQRCCRNNSLSNIVSPLETGTTEWVEITEEALLTGNSSPTFNNWPDVYICANQPLVFDHSGTDIDGDSIVYKTCAPFEGADINTNQPQPPFLPPYGNVVWQSPYSLANMMGGEPLVIDPKTGLITAIPNLVGQYLIGVCMEEYRNGVLISTVRRDFQYNVRVCSVPVVADFNVKVDACDSLSVTFDNISLDADRYEWNFNYPSTDPKFISTDTSPVFKYDMEGAYKVRLLAKSSNGACDSIIIRDIVVANGSDIPDLNLVSDNITICAGEKIALLTSPNSANKYQWSPQQGLDLSDPSNPIFVGVESGIYSVTVTNDNKCTNVGTITINVKPGTTPINIVGDQNICDSLVSLTASGASGTFEWSESQDFGTIISNNANLVAIQNELTKKYFVRSKQAECGDVINEITVTRRVVSIDYDDEVSICKGSEKSLIITNTNPDDVLTFTWNDPHIVSQANNEIIITTLGSDNGSFTVNGIATNQYGCTRAISILVNLGVLDNITFNAQLKSCDDYTMCFSTLGNLGGNVLWSFGSGQVIDTSSSTIPCFTYDSPGTYSVTLTSINAECPFSPVVEEITVPVLGDKNVDINSILQDCNSNNVCFSIDGDYQGNVLWDFGDINSFDNTSTLAAPCHKFSGSGTYNVTLTNDNPLCPFTKVVEVVVIDQPYSLNPIADEIICEGEMVTLKASSNDPASTFVWTNNQGVELGKGSTLDLNPMSDIKVIVTATNAKGCTDMDTVNVIIFKFAYTIDLPQVICPNSEFQIKVNISSPEKYTYEWSPAECVVMGGNTNQPVLLAVPGKSVSVVITNKETGCKETKVITPNIVAPLVYDFSGMLCNDQPSTVSINVSNSDAFTFQWSPSSAIISGGNTSNPVVKVLSGQVLTVVVTEKSTGCTKEIMYTPNVSPALNVSFTENNIEIEQGKDTDLSIKNPLSGAQYNWSTGESGTSINVDPIATTTYTVTVTDPNGCTGVGQITVNVRIVGCTDKDEYLPNAFTPNGDGKNDILYVKSNVITDMTLVIYNRWGQEMKKIVTIDEGWDGTYNGALLAPDAYAYYLKATCINGDQFTKKGNVSILK